LFQTILLRHDRSRHHEREYQRFCESGEEEVCATMLVVAV
jgi:hypothetical protein